MKATLATTIEIKSFDEATGEFEGYASTYGNVDHGNDVVCKGAFDDALSASKFPALCWQHDMKEVIGEWLEMKSDAKGLFVKGRIWINKGIARAEQAFQMLKSNGPKGLSIGFIAKAAQKAKSGVRMITKALLKEISVVTYPMNAEAVILSVKSEGDDFDELIEGKADSYDPMNWTAKDCAACSGRALVSAKKNGDKIALNASTKADAASDKALVEEDGKSHSAHMAAAMAHSSAARAHSKANGANDAMDEHLMAARSHLLIAASLSKSTEKSDDPNLELKSALQELSEKIDNELVKAALRRNIATISST